MKEPLVSVIIPTYNRENTIIKSINSVLNQTYKNIEIIIVDDNSTDNTESLIKSINNSKIQYIKNLVNLGPSGARNKGIKLAKGSYVAFQDSDDEWFPSKLEKQMELFNKDDYSLVYCSYNYFRSNLNYQYPSDKYDLCELEGNIYESMLEMNKISTQTMVIKKQVFDEVGVFCEELSCLEDWELALRICYKYKVGFVKEMLVNVNYSFDSVNFNYRNALDSYIYMVKKNMQLVKDKTKLCEMISAIMRHMIGELNLETLKIYKEKIVPAIMDETMFSILLHETKRSVKYKSNYEMAMLMSEINGIDQSIDIYLKREKINSIAIYGLGRIGHQLIKYLNKTDIKIAYVIDENKSYIKGIETVGINDIFDRQVDAIIVTVPYEFNKISQKINEKLCCKILNFEYILGHELVQF